MLVDEVNEVDMIDWYRLWLMRSYGYERANICSIFPVELYLRRGDLQRMTTESTAATNDIAAAIIDWYDGESPPFSP